MANKKPSKIQTYARLIRVSYHPNFNFVVAGSLLAPVSQTSLFEEHDAWSSAGILNTLYVHYPAGLVVFFAR